MKWIYYITTSLLIIGTGVFSSCKEDDDNLSKAVLASAASINFEAQHASGKIITIYADADWVTEAPEWVSINPATGSGTMDVTITVNDNLRDGAIDNPRKEEIVFRGSTLASRAQVIVFQDGDKYRDCKEYTPDELAALADEQILSLPNVIVTAVTSKGFVISDQATKNESNIYVYNTTPVEVGNKVNVKGVKYTDQYGLVYVESDVLEVVSSGETVSYPTPEDITGKLDTYQSKQRTFVTVAGVLNGNTVAVEGATNGVLLVDKMDIASLNGHNVKIMGYFAGVAVPVIKLIPAVIEDKGVSEIIYFSEDFEWLSPWAIKSGAGKQVEGNGSGTAPSLFSATNEAGEVASDAIIARGYELPEVPGHCIYLQNCYLKFGKTDYQAGITLPAISNVPAGTNLVLSFDWAPMVGGTRKFDPVKVIVTIVNGSQVVELPPLQHSFVDTESTLSWLHAELPIEGVTINADTRISIKSDSWGATGSIYRRWFLDNIKLSKAK